MKNNKITLEIYGYLKAKPDESFTIEQLCETNKFGDKTMIINCLGDLIGKGVVFTDRNFEPLRFSFNKDLDTATLQQLGGVEIDKRPEL